MTDSKLLTVPQVADAFQVTSQTIRNWIDQGLLPALRVGRAYRIREADVAALLERAAESSESMVTRRDLWSPAELRLTRGRSGLDTRSVWEDDDGREMSLRRARD